VNVKAMSDSFTEPPTTSTAERGLMARMEISEAAGAERHAPSVHAWPAGQSAWPRHPPGTHRCATQIRPVGHGPPVGQAMEGWQYPCWQKAGAAQSVSIRQRGSSWQIFSAQSKPGGQSLEPKARQSVFAGHPSLDWHARYSRQRPAVALVQYWPGGQSASVAQSARAHRPASQMSPWPPHEASLMHRRRQAPPWQRKSRLATCGSTPGAQSEAAVQTGRQAPWVTSQR
jgi:hypothetical protein